MQKRTEEAKKLSLRIAELAWEKKAVDVEILEVSGIVGYTDYLVLMSGKSDRQVAAISDHIRDKLAEEKVKPIGVEGRTGGQWILLDYSSVITHVFHEGTRLFYDLERLWHDAPRLELHQPDEPAQEAETSGAYQPYSSPV